MLERLFDWTQPPVFVHKDQEVSPEQAEMMSNSIIAYDKFPPKKRILTDELLHDFQLVDYTLIAGAMEFDAAAGLAK